MALIQFQWMPPPAPEKQRDADEQISIDLGDEYETALTDASQEEIIDLAGKSHNYLLLTKRVIKSYRLRQKLNYCFRILARLLVIVCNAVTSRSY